MNFPPIHLPTIDLKDPATRAKVAVAAGAGVVLTTGALVATHDLNGSGGSKFPSDFPAVASAECPNVGPSRASRDTWEPIVQQATQTLQKGGNLTSTQVRALCQVQVDSQTDGARRLQQGGSTSEEQVQADFVINAEATRLISTQDQLDSRVANSASQIEQDIKALQATTPKTTAFARAYIKLQQDVDSGNAVLLSLNRDKPSAEIAIIQLGDSAKTVGGANDPVLLITHVPSDTDRQNQITPLAKALSDGQAALTNAAKSATAKQALGLARS